MSAANTDKFKKARRKFSTTIGVGGCTAGTTTIPLSSVTGLDTDTAVTVIIAPGTNTEEVVTGVVSGTSLANCLRGLETTTANAHAENESVVMYFTETHWDDAMTGILTSHNQDGTHKSNSVSNAALLDGAVTTAKIADSNVTTAKIADSNVTTAKIATGAVTGSKLSTMLTQTDDLNQVIDIGDTRLIMGRGLYGAPGGTGWYDRTVTFPGGGFLNSNYVVVVGAAHAFAVEYNVHGSGMGQVGGHYGDAYTYSATQFVIRAYSGNGGNGGGYSYIAIGKKP